MQLTARPVGNEDGMVMILVLLVLVSVIIMGVQVMQTSTTETRIAGNEREYKQDFYAADSAVDYALENYGDALKAVKVTVGNEYQYNTDAFPDLIKANTLGLSLTGIQNPPIGSGFSVDDFRCRYYTMQSGRGQQTIEAGAWKPFPK